MNVSSIDIIIPSFRADPKYLEPIFNLEKPEDAEIMYYLIIDNPKIEQTKRLTEYQRRKDVIVLRNKINKGASASRNKGIEEGKGEWILFLDDDIFVENNLIVKYIDAITQSETNVPGFVGVTEFPKPINSFTKGIMASDILTFFPLAKKEDKMAWGVTANLLLNRKDLGNFRFREDIFPKFGGGEDIDLCLNIVQKKGMKFNTLPEAEVTHPWWNNGKRSYKRFKRWAYGDSILPKFHKQHRYYNFPNIIESLIIYFVVGVILSILKLSPIPFVLSILLVLIGDFIVEWFKIIKNKGLMSPITALEATIIRASNDFGRLLGNIKRLNMFGFMQRFDYFCDGKHIKTERIWAGIKSIVYFVFTSASCISFFIFG